MACERLDLMLLDVLKFPDYRVSPPSACMLDGWPGHPQALLGVLSSWGCVGTLLHAPGHSVGQGWGHPWVQVSTAWPHWLGNIRKSSIITFYQKNPYRLARGPGATQEV